MSQSGILSLNSAIFPPGSVVETLQGNSGGTVPPNAFNNLFVVGDAVTATVVGTPLSNTLTISVLPGAVKVVPYVSVDFAASPYTVLSTGYYISCDITGGTIILYLPVAPAVGRVFIVKDRLGLAGGGNTISITTSTGLVGIDGSSVFIMNTAYEAVQLVFNGTAYEIF